MAAAVEYSDIDKFIQNQKVKLQQERDHISDAQPDRVGRKQWERPGDTNIAEQRKNMMRRIGVGPSNHNSIANQGRLRLMRQRAYDFNLKKKSNRTNETQQKTFPVSPTHDRPKPSTQDVGLKLGSYEEKSNKLKEERKREYQEYVNTKNKQQQSRANLGDNTPRKPLVDHRRWNQSFQQEKKKDYNEFVQKPKPKKAATPPHAGMRFGEYEDFKKQTDGYRKEAYRQQLEKQQYDQARQHAVKIRLVEDGDQPPEEAEVRLAEEQDTRRKVQKHRKDLRDKFVEDKKFREFEKMLALNRQNGVKLPELEDEYGTDQEEDQVPGEQDWREEFLSPRRAPVEDLDVQQFHIDMSHVSGTNIPQQKKTGALVWENNYEKKKWQMEKQQEYNDYLRKKSDQQSGLKLGEHETQRKKLNDERHHEYNEMIKQKYEPAPKRQWEDVKDEESGLPLSNDDKKKKQMALDRNREYNEMLKKQEQALKFKKTNESSSVPFGAYEDKRKKLLEERQKEYKKLLEKHDKSSEDRKGQITLSTREDLLYKQYLQHLQDILEDSTEVEHLGPPSSPQLMEYILKLRLKRRLLREQMRLLQKKQEEDKQKVQARLPPKPSTPGGMFSKLGKHEDERTKLNEERKLEYNQLLAEQARALVGVVKSFASLLDKEREHTEALNSVARSLASLTEKDEILSGDKRSPQPRGSDTGHRDTPPERDIQEREIGRDVVDRDRERGYPDRGRDRDYIDRGRDRDYPERGRDRDYPDRGRDRDYPDRGRDRDYPERGRDYPERDRDRGRDRDYPDRGRDRDYPDRDRDYQGRGRDRDYPERGRDRDYPDRDRDYQDRGRDYQDRGYQDADRNQGQDYHDTRNDESVGIQALRNRDSADLKKQKTRNEEYNEFLRQKQEKDKHRFDDKKPKQQRQDRRNGRPSSEPDGQRKKKEEIFASLPGINYNGSAQKRKILERNQEYNELLRTSTSRTVRGRQSDRPPAGPRKGWQTPNYEEILDKKRKEEASYRRDDPQIERGMRAYASEGALDNLEADERRYKKLDQIYDDRKVKFRDQRANQSILDDDEWLNKGRDRAKEEEYRELKDNTRSEPPRPTPRGGQGQDPAMAAKYYATLPVGQDERESAKRRRKEKYRDELQLQMRERQAAERREKIEDLKVNASGLLDPEKTSHRLQRLGDPDLTPRRNIRSPEVKAYHTKFDLSPRGGRGLGLDDGGYGGGGYTARERGRPRERRYNAGYGAGGGGGGGYDGGILDEGFKLLEPRRQIGSLGPPARLQYQPSSYVTADQGGLGPAFSSIDDAYHAYALKNPLDPEPAGVPPLGLDRLDGGGGGYYGRSSPRVTFDDSSKKEDKEGKKSRLRDRSKERISPYQFPSDDDVRSRSRTDQRSYQNELDRQIQEKKMQKLREKEEQQRYERKLEDDIKNYNPFGRGGGGAPNRDQQGNVIADLRKMRGGQYSARSPPPPRESPRLRPPGSPKDDLFRPPPTQTDASGDPTHARGGHGIFGMPRTDAEKDTAERYKDDLRRQIEEKRRLDQQEREREKIEEEKENRRLEEQRKRIQQEYEEELRKKRDKEEEVRRKNEEMRLEAEERKREAERKKRENAENRRQLKEDKENSPRQPEPRGSSPPVPALKSHLATEDGEPSRLDSPESNIRVPPSTVPRTSEEVRRNSPPIPALRKAEPENQAPEPVARANSSDVLKELANMRQQLQSERRRVENALETQRNEPTVFDPRTLQRPAPKEIDVFERAKIGAPTVPVRTADNANAKNLHDFYNLKHGYNSDSRKGLRSMFPEAPVTNSALDSQQNALLRQQEDSLNAMKQRGPAASRLATPTRQGTVSPRSLLQSNSAFIDIDGVNNFPDDFEDLPRRNESARYRRRERVTVSPRPESQPVNPLGSTTSLDVDHIQRKNDARLRRLHQMNTDEVSLADPDDILDRFMAKQKYNRPPSGQTLQDDTWLRPTSKAI